jgi:hypothetical protein
MDGSGGKGRVPESVYITRKLDKLQYRIKNTSSTRFSASKRVRFNYDLGALTIIILSLWAIYISIILGGNFVVMVDGTRKLVEVTGILLPVFIVVFSLVEGGNNYLRSHQLELNARQLRELADELAGEVTKEEHTATTDSRAALFEKFSKKYNDILERSPINHDEIDHWSRHYVALRNDQPMFRGMWWLYSALVVAIWARRQAQRVVYLALWFIPALPFLLR